MSAEKSDGYDRRRGPRDRALRVGDREREAVAEILRQHHLEGRLDAGEFQDRVGRCLAAKTYGELDRLIDDLPGHDSEHGRIGRARAFPFWGVVPLPLALIPLGLVAAIVLTGGHLAWLAFPLLFLFVLRPLLWRTWGRGYGYGFWGCGPRSSSRTGTRM